MKNLLLGFVALLLSVSAANAVQIQFQVLESRWDNVAGGPPLSVDDVFAGGTQSVRWGGGCNFGADLCSGYDFTSVNQVTSAPNTPFILGDFTHQNFPILAGTSIDSVDLFLRGNLFIDAEDGNGFQSFGQRTFDFSFDHDETPNVQAVCPAATGNENGCADIVDVSALIDDEELIIGDQLVVLSILGFREDGIFTEQFISPELGSTTAEVIGQFTVSTVPLPAPVVLLISALIGLGFISRRKTL